MYRVLTLSLLMAAATAVAQSDYAVNGRVVDAVTEEALPGATLWVIGTSSGTASDDGGRFELSLSGSGEYRVIVSYIGYITDTIDIDRASGPVRIALKPGMLLEEVVISDQPAKAASNYERTRMSYVDLSMREVNRLPALLSENDVLKAVQLLPGIQSSEGASTGFYVRGGSSDQNLILLNDAVVYNPFHAAGFLSIFNGDIVDDISIHKTAFPSQYGGRLSSHLQVDTKTPSFDEVRGSAGIGLVTARLSLELPVVKDKLSLMLSGRGFYSYSLFRAFASDALRKDLPKYYFYDTYGQVSWKPTPKDRINAYFYRGKDLVDFQDKSTADSSRFTIPWSNTAAGLNWSRLLTDGVSLKFSAYHSRYDFAFDAGFTSGSQGLSTAIREYGAKLLALHQAGDHLMTYGGEVVHQSISPSVVRDEQSQYGTNTRVADVSARYHPVTAALFFNDDWTITPRLGLNFGVRVPVFVGNGQVYTSVDPKAVLRYKINATSSLKASYSFSSQFIHMLVSSTATTPLDLWIGSSRKVKPQRGHAAALGWYRNFADDGFEFSIEGYYRALRNQIEYVEGAEVFSDDDIESKLQFGRGWTAGTEIFLRKHGERLSGFVGYTLSWAYRHFDGLNGGKPFPYKYDRRHDLTFSMSYDFNARWSISTLFVIGSGQPLTVPRYVTYTPRSQGSGTFVYEYGDRNSYRLKPYHRMDLSLRYSGRQKRVQSHFKFDIYNLYNRKNAFFVLLDARYPSNGANEVYLREYALIPITPSISYQMDF